MKNIFLNKKAMTLPELIIVVVLITIVLGAAIMPYIMQQDLLKKQMAISKLQDEVSVALAYIEKDIFTAGSLERDKTSGGFEDFPISATEDHTRVGIDTDLNLGADIYHVYRLSGTDLQRDGTTIASNITILSFTRTSDNYIEIDITGEDRGQTVSMDLGVALRAVAA